MIICKEGKRKKKQFKEEFDDLRHKCDDLEDDILILKVDRDVLIKAYRKIQELLKQNDYNSITNLKNKINTILDDCNLNKYRV